MQVLDFEGIANTCIFELDQEPEYLHFGNCCHALTIRFLSDPVRFCSDPIRKNDQNNIGTNQNDFIKSNLNFVWNINNMHCKLRIVNRADICFSNCRK